MDTAYFRVVVKTGGPLGQLGLVATPDLGYIEDTRARGRSMERITIDPAICHGKPTIRGLRYPVEMILELLSSGMTYDEVLADCSDLEREDILAALSYA